MDDDSTEEELVKSVEFPSILLDDSNAKHFDLTIDIKISRKTSNKSAVGSSDLHLAEKLAAKGTIEDRHVLFQKVTELLKNSDASTSKICPGNGNTVDNIEPEKNMEPVLQTEGLGLLKFPQDQKAVEEIKEYCKNYFLCKDTRNEAHLPSNHTMFNNPDISKNTFEEQHLSWKRVLPDNSVVSKDNIKEQHLPLDHVILDNPAVSENNLKEQHLPLDHVIFDKPTNSESDLKENKLAANESSIESTTLERFNRIKLCDEQRFAGHPPVNTFDTTNPYYDNPHSVFDILNTDFSDTSSPSGVADELWGDVREQFVTFDTCGSSEEKETWKSSKGQDLPPLQATVEDDCPVLPSEKPSVPDVCDHDVPVSLEKSPICDMKVVKLYCNRCFTKKSFTQVFYDTCALNENISDCSPIRPSVSVPIGLIDPPVSYVHDIHDFDCFIDFKLTLEDLKRQYSSTSVPRRFKVVDQGKIDATDQWNTIAASVPPGIAGADGGPDNETIAEIAEPCQRNTDECRTPAEKHESDHASVRVDLESTVADPGKIAEVKILFPVRSEHSNRFRSSHSIDICEMFRTQAADDSSHQHVLESVKQGKARNKEDKETIEAVKEVTVGDVDEASCQVNTEAHAEEMCVRKNSKENGPLNGDHRIFSSVLFKNQVINILKGFLKENVIISNMDTENYRAFFIPIENDKQNSKPVLRVRTMSSTMRKRYTCKYGRDISIGASSGANSRHGNYRYQIKNRKLQLPCKSGGLSRYSTSEAVKPGASQKEGGSGNWFEQHNSFSAFRLKMVRNTVRRMVSNEHKTLPAKMKSNCARSKAENAESNSVDYVPNSSFQKIKEYSREETERPGTPDGNASRVKQGNVNRKLKVINNFDNIKQVLDEVEMKQDLLMGLLHNDPCGILYKFPVGPNEITN